MPMRRTPHSSAARTILYRVALALHRISTALPRVWALFPLRPFASSHSRLRYAQVSTSGMPAASRTRSSNARNAGSICWMEHAGMQRWNSAAVKYLLIPPALHPHPCTGDAPVNVLLDTQPGSGHRQELTHGNKHRVVNLPGGRKEKAQEGEHHPHKEGGNAHRHDYTVFNTAFHKL